MPNCNSCGRPIHWGKTENGKRVPLDMKPKNVYVLINPEKEIYAVYRGFETHFVTCPNAAQHRRGG